MTTMSNRAMRAHKPVLAVLMFAVLTALAALGPVPAAEAGAPGQNPVGCTPAATWRYKDYSVNGWSIRQELRHSYACGNVGWARLNRSGSGGPTKIVQTVWNPGGPSWGQVPTPGATYTYTVNASPGREVCAGFQAYRYDHAGREIHIGWFFTGCYRT